MFPISHVYMLNRLVKTELRRNLDERDALQIMGAWLLDALITDKVRQKTKSAQKFFHMLNYSANQPKPEIEKLMAGINIHVMCDNLANKGRLEYVGDDDGFLAKKIDLVRIPEDGIEGELRTFKRKILECGLDMLVIEKAEEQVRGFFLYAINLVRHSNICDDTYAMFKDLILAEKNRPGDINKNFINEILSEACKTYIKNFAHKYDEFFYYMSCDCRRTKSARDYAGKKYSDMHCMVELIKNNSKAFQGWEQDFDDAVKIIIDNKPEIIKTFSR